MKSTIIPKGLLSNKDKIFEKPFKKIKCKDNTKKNETADFQGEQCRKSEYNNAEPLTLTCTGS